MKCKYVAVAKLRSTEDAEEPSSVVVGIQGLSEAIDCRKRSKGSCSEVDIMSNSIEATGLDIFWCFGGEIWKARLLEGELLQLVAIQ